MTTQINETLVNKILNLLSFGLTKGVGNPKPGEMCIEAAICYALGEPHGDDPSCVGSEVKNAKISLNDCEWSSNKARAEGMKKLAIAQLGSIDLNQEEFRDRLKLNSTKRLLPFLLGKTYEKIKDESLLVYKKKFEDLSSLESSILDEFYYSYSYYYQKYYYYYPPNYYYYNNCYYYYYDYCALQYGDEFLLLFADVILQTLIEMNCEGCKYLYLVDQSVNDKV